MTGTWVKINKRHKRSEGKVEKSGYSLMKEQVGTWAMDGIKSG
jgi:hypothetical protein